MVDLTKAVLSKETGRHCHEKVSQLDRIRQVCRRGWGFGIATTIKDNIRRQSCVCEPAAFRVDCHHERKPTPAVL